MKNITFSRKKIQILGKGILNLTHFDRKFYHVPHPSTTMTYRCHTDLLKNGQRNINVYLLICKFGMHEYNEHHIGTIRHWISVNITTATYYNHQTQSITFRKISCRLMLCQNNSRVERNKVLFHVGKYLYICTCYGLGCSELNPSKVKYYHIMFMHRFEPRV